MAVTFEQVVGQLDREEPDYEQAAQLGPAALPHLMLLIQEGDPNLGSKATYLAALINAEQSPAAVELAAHSPEPLLRIAAAGALGQLAQIPESLALDLLDDEEVGVRHWTLRALDAHPIPGLNGRVRDLAEADPEPAVRQLASQVMQHSP